MDRVFVVQHLHRLPNGEEDVKLIGVYRSAESARAAINRIKHRPGFCDHPNMVDSAVDKEMQGFCIDEYPLDKDHWIEGFVTQ